MDAVRGVGAGVGEDVGARGHQSGRKVFWAGRSSKKLSGPHVTSSCMGDRAMIWTSILLEPVSIVNVMRLFIVDKFSTV